MEDEMTPLVHILAEMIRPQRGHRLVFTYDKFMDDDRFQTRFPEAWFVSTGRLLHRRWIANSDGLPSIVPCRGHVVYGVVWETAESAEPNFEARHGCGAVEQRGAFARSPDELLMAIEYHAPSNHRFGEADWTELLQTLAAARVQRFPETYLNELATWSPRPVEASRSRTP